MLDNILVFRGRTQTALAAAALTRINGDGRSFDIAGDGYGNYNVLIRYQVLDRKFGTGVDDLGLSGIAEILFDLLKLVDDHLAKNAFVLQDILKLGDVLDDVLVLV